MEVLDRVLSATALPAAGKEELPVAAITAKLIGISGWAESVRRTIVTHASHDSPILIEGEAGTGKEFIARLIHECSHRRNGPFVAISFDDVSEESARAVLFGIERPNWSERSFTPRCLLEAAHGGTLYINGLVEMSADLKMSIARFIRTREFRVPGEFSENRSVENADVRIMLGSVSESAGDLPISDTLLVPPLRRRREDIEPLLRHFTARVCEHLGREQREIAPDALAALRGYDWPGNISEIKSVVAEMIARSGPPALNASLIPDHIADAAGISLRALPPAGINLAEELERIEKTLIAEALRMSHGVQYKAAQLLGLKPTTLNMKLSRLGIDPKASG